LIRLSDSASVKRFFRLFDCAERYSQKMKNPYT